MTSSSCSTAISIRPWRASRRRQPVGRDVFVDELGAEALVEPDDRAFSTRSTRPLKPPSMPIGRYSTAGRAPRRSLIMSTQRSKLAPAVELVDEAHPRHVVLGLAPHGLRLRLDAGNAVEAGDRAVEHAQRALDLDGEVDVAGRVDDVDAVLFALAVFARQKQVVAADVMVMPRSCSCSIQSMVAVPSCTSPIL